MQAFETYLSFPSITREKHSLALSKFQSAAILQWEIPRYKNIPFHVSVN